MGNDRFQFETSTAAKRSVQICSVFPVDYYMTYYIASSVNWTASPYYVCGSENTSRVARMIAEPIGTPASVAGWASRAIKQKQIEHPLDLDQHGSVDAAAIVAEAK